MMTPNEHKKAPASAGTLTRTVHSDKHYEDISIISRPMGDCKGGDLLWR